MRSGAHTEMMIRRRNAQFVEEHVTHSRIVVLACMNDLVLSPS
jgi:hypothetical protein